MPGNLICRPRLARVPWSYIVIDEGHRLKSAGCKLNTELKQYKAAHRLLLTGALEPQVLFGRRAR